MQINAVQGIGNMFVLKYTHVNISFDLDLILRKTKALRWRLGSIPMTESEIRRFLKETKPKTGFDKFLANLGIDDDIRSKYEEFIELKDKIRLLSKKKFIATDVFVTFETEAAQRKALSLLRFVLSS